MCTHPPVYLLYFRLYVAFADCQDDHPFLLSQEPLQDSPASRGAEEREDGGGDGNAQGSWSPHYTPLEPFWYRSGTLIDVKFKGLGFED